ncbi:MAG TPA: hypothetical protein V6C76_02085 [Drouetiella sp.]
MFDRTLFKTNALAVSVAILSIVSLASCSTKNTSNTANVTPQGTVSLDTVKVGMPEQTFKDATITFIVDSKPAASGQGKTQYLSRTYDKKGGQYVAQVKGGKCFALQALYKTTPLTKEEALEMLKNLLPGDAPPQSKLDDSQLKAGKGEIVEYGTTYTGLLQYADKTNTKVEAITAFDLAPDAVREGLNWNGKAPKGGDAAKGADKGGKSAKKAEKSAPAAEKTEAPAAETSTSTSTETTTSTTTTP